MKHQWVAYVIVAILSIGAGVAIAGMPDSVPVSETIIPPTTTLAPEPTVPTTTTPAVTTTEAPDDTEPDATTTTEADETTTTVEILEPRSEVGVAVANGSGRAGVAVATAAELVGLGYANVAALNGLVVVDQTIVYYAAGNDGIAERMAADLGLPPDAIAPFVAAPDVENLGIVQLLVYVGADRG